MRPIFTRLHRFLGRPPSPLTRSPQRLFAAMSEAVAAAPVPPHTSTNGFPSEPLSKKRLGETQSPEHNQRAARKAKYNRTKRERNITEGSSEEVLRADIDALLKSRRAESAAQATSPPAAAATTNVDEDAASPVPLLPEPLTELDVEVLELSSTGDGLAMVPSSSSEQVYVVPFTVPGDSARIKVIRHVRGEGHSHADLLSVTTPSALRDDSRIRCKYFARCGGCQLQMLDYPEQLRRKRRVVVKAFANFANLPPELIPAVGDTIGSPLQYGYRTKLTPHFDGPPGWRHSRGRGKAAKENRAVFTSCPDVGFMLKGRRKVIDIEDCPIGSDAVRLGNTRERLRMQKEYADYKRGATLLLRENTTRHPKDSDAAAADPPPYTVKTESGDFVDIKSCESDFKATTTEYVGDYVFTNPAGSFFQNNNSILPIFTSYIRDNILPNNNTATKPIRYLIDAYSGSGLFTITLSSVFEQSTGIDIAADSIASARRNAALNGLADDRCRFQAADAATQLFRSVAFPPDETAIVIDPPRKGCDADFLAQLRAFGPRRVVYVSCNVHTQARDVGVLVRGGDDGCEGDGGSGRARGSRYQIESLVGFDFFPQTSHVEGVAILNRVDEKGE